MTEKVKGVTWDKRYEKWQSRITLNKETKHLGYFYTYEEAVQARKDAEIKYNFVPLTPAPKLKQKNDLTQETLKELFHYDPDTGIFTWKVRPANQFKIGDIAGSLHKDGYIQIKINNNNYLAHRLAFLYMNGEFPEKGLDVDHINQIKDDNRWKNLRLVTRKENSRNCSMSENNKSGYTGVCEHNRTNKWQSYIMVDGKQEFLGFFDNLDDAIAVRKAAEIEYGFHENHGKLKQIKGE